MQHLESINMMVVFKSDVSTFEPRRLHSILMHIRLMTSFIAYTCQKHSGMKAVEVIRLIPLLLSILGD